MSVRAVLVDGMVILDDTVVGERTIIAGASPGPQVDLSTLGNGVLQQTVTAGVAALSVTAISNPLAKYIVQQPDASVPNAQALSALTTGLVKNTTTTGVLSIAVDGVDYVSPPDLKYQTVQIGGSSEPQQQRLNFISGATATNNPGNNSTDINISGASIYADGVVTGIIELASVPAALLQVGSLAYVASVDDYFSLQLSALTPDDLTVVTASGRSGYQWIRLNVPSLQWAAAATWWVDPAAGNDEATGTASLSPLKSYAELSRRLNGRTTNTGLTVNMVSDATDADLLSLNLAPVFGTSVALVGVETQLASGTVSTFVAPNFGPGGNTLNKVTVVGFNWAPWVGFMVRKHGASDGTGVYASVLADLGSGTALIAPTSLSGAPSFASYFQSGEVIEVVGYTKAPLVQTENTTTIDFVFAALYRAVGAYAATMHGVSTTILLEFCSVGVGSTFSTQFSCQTLTGEVLATANGITAATPHSVNFTNIALTGTGFYSFGSTGSTVNINDSVLYPTSPSTTFPLISIGQSAFLTLSSRTSPGIGFGVFNLAANSIGIALGNNSVLTASAIFGANNNPASWWMAYPSGTKVSLQRGLQTNYYETSSAGVKVDWFGNPSANSGSSIPNVTAGWGPELLDRYQSGRGPALASTSRLVPQGLLSFREWNITGSNTINTITQFPETNQVTILNDGLIVELDIQDGLTITHNASHTVFVDAPILLAGGVNAILPAGSHIVLKWNAQYGSGVGVWVEVGRDSSTSLSVLGNPTAAPALTQPIASTGANLFLGSNAANTGLAFVPVPGATVRADGVAVGTVQLVSLASAALSDGTLCWVDSVGDYFRLAQGALSTTPLTVVTASGKAGYQWLRLNVPNPSIWNTVANWYIDPVSGNDENNGSSSGTALKTNAEWSRRMANAVLSSFPALNWIGDIPDADTLTVSANAASEITGAISILGSQTVLSTQVVTSAQAKNSAANQANEITVSGFDWTPYVNHFLRVQGTTNYSAITKNMGAGRARLGEQVNFSTVTNASVTNGQTVEILKTTKGPLNLQINGNIEVFLQNVALDGSGPILIANGGGATAVLLAAQTIFGGTSVNVASLPNIELFGCLITSGGVWPGGVWEGTAISSGGASLAFQAPAQLSCYPKIRSTVWQGTPLTLASARLHVDGDFGQFDLGAGVTGIDINGSNGIAEGSSMHFNSGRYYGSGSAPTSIAWNVGFGCQVCYNPANLPNVATGVNIAIDGDTITFASLPYPLNPWSGASVVAQGVLTSPTTGFLSISTTPGTTVVPRVLTNTDGTITIANPDGVAGNPVINTSGLVPAARTVQGTAPVAIAGDHSVHDLSTNRVWSLDANGVTYSFIQQVSAACLLGNPTGSVANVSEITLGANLVFVGSVLNTTGLTPTTRTVQGTAPISIAGDHVTHDLSANRVWSLDANGVTYAFIQQVGADRLVGNPTGSPANASEIGVIAPLGFSGGNLVLNYDSSSLVLSGGTTLVRAALTGDVAATIGLNATTIQPHVVTYAKMQQASAGTLLGNPTGGLANVSEITLGTGLAFSGTTLINTAPGLSLTWPAVTEVLFSAGTSSTPVGSANMTFASNTLALNGTLVVGTHVTGVQTSFFSADVIANIAQVVAYPAAGSNVAQTLNIIPKGTGTSGLKAALSIFNTDWVADSVDYEQVAFEALGTTGFAIVTAAAGTGAVRKLALATGTNSTQMVLNTSGTVSLSSLAAGGIVSADTSGTLGLITIGSGLSFSGGILSATGGGGSGTVTSVSGTAPIFITSTPTTTPNVTIQGSIVSGSSTTSAQDLGALTNGTLQQTVTTGVATISAFNGTAGSIPFYATNGQLAQDNAHLFWSGTALGIGTNTPGFPIDVLESATLTGFRITNTSASSSSQIQNQLKNDINSIAFYGISSSTFTGFTPLNGGNAFFGSFQANAAFFTVDAHDLIFFTNAIEEGRLASGGAFSLQSLTAGGLVKSAVTTGVLSQAVPGTDYVASVSTTSPILNSGSPTAPSLSFAASGVSPGVYITPQITVDVFGRITSAAFVNTYQQIESDGVPITGEATLNFVAPLHAADSGGSPFRTNATLLFDNSSLSLNGSNQLQRAALGGDLLSSAGSNSINVVAVHETSGPTRLDIGAIPDSNPDTTVLVRAAGTGTVTGVALKTLLRTSPGASYKFSMNASSSGGIGNDLQTVVVAGDSGPVPTGAGFYTAVPGTAVTTTLAANYATNGGPVAYGAMRTYTSIAFQVYQNFIQMAVANGTVLTYALYKTNSGITAGGYIPLASWNTGAMNIGTSSGATSGIVTASVSVSPGDLLMLTVFRTDTTAAMLLLLQFTATVDLFE